MIDLEKVFVQDMKELRNWLEEHHDQKESVWLVKWKKDHAEQYLDYDQVVDELMCYGWVDSLPRNLDSKRTMLRISPRNPKSNWSGLNKQRIERLIRAGRMKPAGLKIVEEAKRNGAWDFLDDVEQLQVPDDLEAAFKANADAWYFYDRFPDSSKRGILEWIKNAKQDSTREKRITETVTKAAKNIKANHPKGRDAGPKVPR